MVMGSQRKELRTSGTLVKEEVPSFLGRIRAQKQEKNHPNMTNEMPGEVDRH